MSTSCLTFLVKMLVLQTLVASNVLMGTSLGRVWMGLLCYRPYRRRGVCSTSASFWMIFSTICGVRSNTTARSQTDQFRVASSTTDGSPIPWSNIARYIVEPMFAGLKQPSTLKASQLPALYERLYDAQLTEHALRFASVPAATGKSQSYDCSSLRLMPLIHRLFCQYNAAGAWRPIHQHRRPALTDQPLL